MPYIGNQPAEQFTSFATQTFSVSATTSYTLDHAVTNENEIALFVNNVRQQPGSGKAYTATGTALTLSAATASTDTMYCVFLGRALQTVTPATNSITAAMVSNDLISGKDALTDAPASTDEFLVSDAGVLKRIDASLVGRGKLLQVVSAVADVEVSSTSSTYADISEMTASITPSSASNKVLVLVQIANASKTGGDSQLDLRLLRDSTAVHLIGGLNDGSSTAQTSLGGIMIFLDSPSSTSSLTYKVQLSNRDGNGTVTVQGNNKDGSITLMEIAG